MLRRNKLTTVPGMRSSTILSSFLRSPARHVRTQIPPRPRYTVICYLDNYGNPVKTKIETEIAVVRDRENKFWLQRQMPDQSMVRWGVPGMAMLRHSDNFEHYCIGDIDMYGGVDVPLVMGIQEPHYRPGLDDATHCLINSASIGKWLRRHRRSQDRSSLYHWSECADRAVPFLAITVLSWSIVLISVASLYWEYSEEGYTMFGGAPTDTRLGDGDMMGMTETYMRRHPELAFYEYSPYIASRGIQNLQSMRMEINEIGEQYSNNWGTDILWKIGHYQRFGHWPKSLLE